MELLQHVVMRIEQGTEDRDWERWRLRRIIGRLPSGRSVFPNGPGCERVKRNHEFPDGRRSTFDLMQAWLDESNAPDEFDDMYVVLGFKKKAPHSICHYRFFT